jgi:hypothetical protein
MRIVHFVVICLLLAVPAVTVAAETPSSPQEQAVSDTLDLWREGRYEQLFDQLSHRGKISRELFVKKMHETTIRPACCWQKLENFRVLSEKRNTATVYTKIGLEGTPAMNASSTREFKLNFEGGGWRMQLNDLYSLAGISGKKARVSHKKRVYYR